MSRPVRSTHGDYGYAKKHKCKCPPCVTASRRYVKLRAVDQARGISRRIDPTRSRKIIEGFLAAGAQEHQIARAAGLAPTSIKNILRGTRGEPAKWVLRETAAKLAALTEEQVFGVNCWVSPLGVHRRIDALRSFGHSCQDIADEIGVSESQIYHYLEADYVSSKTVEQVDRAYRVLSLSPGANSGGIWRGRREGRPTPMCWDDEAIDDPNGKPHARRCVIRGCSRASTRATLCRDHYDEVSKRGGIAENKKRYREVVIRVSQRKNYDSAAMRASARECLVDHGMSVDTTALHLGASRDFVDRVKRELNDAAR